MTAKEPIESRLEKLGRAIGSDESLVQNVMGQINSIKIDQKKFAEFKSSSLLRRFIMNRLTKLAAAAVIIIAGVLSITFLHKSVAPAYALEQTIQSYQGMRYLHTKFLCGENDAVAKEFWFEFDESGRIKKMRINHSEWFDGCNVYIWNENETKAWNPKRNTLMIFNDEIYTSRVLGMDEVKGPRLIVEHLYDQEAKGLVE
ncbi:MAG: hypothetical protein MUO27_10900, partial [Sedimentisphaerales bacterium]|nr:hypothetical protein [Sedimentisphaerales bacterium]